jgi:hypothetical protein
MRRLVYPKQWDEEWYTSWMTRKLNFQIPKDRLPDYFSTANSRDFESDSMRYDRSESEEEEEVYDTSIGNIITMRYRAGERMTKVHHNHTSFLYKSRWRKKYFPRGFLSN